MATGNGIVVESFSVPLSCLQDTKIKRQRAFSECCSLYLRTFETTNFKSLNNDVAKAQINMNKTLTKKQVAYSDDSLHNICESAISND